MRGRHGQFPEYHTSADNLAFVTGEHLVESLDLLESIVAVVDRNRVVRNLEPYGEPQLGRRGLYRALGGAEIPDLQLAMLWVLNLADGRHDLLAIASVRASPSTPSSRRPTYSSSMLSSMRCRPGGDGVRCP